MNPTALCELTHTLIQRGNCPWCGLGINVKAIDQHSRPALPSWDIEAMRVILQDSDHEGRALALVNVSRGDGFGINDQIELLSLVLRNKVDLDRRVAEGVLLLSGSKLSEENATRLESRLGGSTYQFAILIPLLAFYTTNLTSQANESRRLEIVLWLVEHESDCFTAGSPYARILRKTNPAGYETVKSVWLKQASTEKPTTATLRNAAVFLKRDDPAESERLRTQADSLEQGN